MKFFWAYVLGFIVIWLICSYVVTVRDTFVSSSSTPQKSEGISTSVYDPVITDIEYHDSHDTIRANNRHKTQNMFVKNKDGKPVAIFMEPTQNFSTYHTPGSFLYGASNYVPSYEDSVKLSKLDLVRSLGHNYNLVRTENGLLTMEKPEKK